MDVEACVPESVTHPDLSIDGVVEVMLVDSSLEMNVSCLPPFFSSCANENNTRSEQ